MDKFKEVYNEIITEGFFDKAKQFFSNKKSETTENQPEKYEESEDSTRRNCGELKINITYSKDGDKITYFCKRINGKYLEEGKGPTIDDAIIDWVKLNNFGDPFGNS